MKRIFSIISLILLICVAMTACGGDGTDKPSEPVDNTVYGKLTSAMSSRDFDTLTVTVATTKDELTLTSTYVYKTVDGNLAIDYSIEILGQFDKNGENYTAPDSMIKTVSGSVVVSGGKIISTSGDPAPLDLSGAKYPEFKFKEGYFSSVETADGEFSASVLSPMAFMGMSDSCSNMTVRVYYNVFRVSTLHLEYKATDGSQVKTTYIYR
ncbi:MAG: hypothetical protein IJW03_05510 [Clostridia bacterium]|nr:hypothetical protein [Clostridia bacterium]